MDFPWKFHLVSVELLSRPGLTYSERYPFKAKELDDGFHFVSNGRL